MDELEVPCPDPNEPVTRRILQEELSRYFTRDELRQELSKYPTREQLDTILDSKMEAKFLEFEKRIGLQIKAAIEEATTRMQQDLFQLSKSLIEELRSEFRGAFQVVASRVDELEPRITTIEPRVTVLEQRTAALEAPRRVSRPRRSTAKKHKKR